MVIEDFLIASLLVSTNFSSIRQLKIPTSLSLSLILVFIVTGIILFNWSSFKFFISNTSAVIISPYIKLPKER